MPRPRRFPRLTEGKQSLLRPAISPQTPSNLERLRESECKPRPAHRLERASARAATSQFREDGGCGPSCRSGSTANERREALLMCIAYSLPAALAAFISRGCLSFLFPVVVLFKATGDAPILKQSKFKVRAFLIALPCSASPVDRRASRVRPLNSFCPGGLRRSRRATDSRRSSSSCEDSFNERRW